MKVKKIVSLVTSMVMVASFATLALAAPSEPIIKSNAVEVQSSITEAVPFNPLAPAQPEKGEIIEYTLEAMRANLEISPGVVKEVWTFNGSVPGPTLRVHQGDTVRFTLVNKDPEMAHGLDFHAVQLDMGKYHQAVKPGESITFDWEAKYPGVFYYHCSADPVIMHIANGMFGAVIVDPPNYVPEGKEYVLIQHEWYENSMDLNALINEAPQFMAFNGVPMQYVDAPLTAEAGEKVKFYFVNAGINNFSSSHIIGTIFDKVFLDGNPANVLHGVQTVAVPPGGALTAELYADEGTYAILTHSMKDAMKGALGILKVGEPTASTEGHSHGPGEVIPAPSKEDSKTNSNTNEVSNATKVVMKNFAYGPKKTTVKTGETVTWENQEATLHTIVGEQFDSRNEDKDGLDKSGVFSHTFDKSGTYDYHCSLHPFMTGTINVE